MSQQLDREIDLKAIGWFTIGLAATVLVTGVLMWAASAYLRDAEIAKDPPAPALEELRATEPPPAPRLQTDPPRDINELREREQALLDTYGWVDEEAGIARIPVERAMAILAEDGENGEDGDG